MKRILVVCLTAVLAIACARVAAAAPADPASLIKEFLGQAEPVKRSPADLQAAYAAVLDSLLPGMADADPGKRFKAMDEFSKICLRAGRPGAEAERAAVCLAILPKLAAPTPPLVRAWLIRQVQWIGKAESVPALAALLADKDLMVRDCARRALEANPSPEAGAALLAAIAKTDATDTEDSLVGLINSVAARHDVAAVPAIAEALKDKRIGVTLAAVAALGRIGTPDAAAALAKFQAGAFQATSKVTPYATNAKGGQPITDAKFLAAIQDALIHCAEQLLADGKKDAAADIYTSLYVEANPTAVRVAALRGLAQTQGAKAIATLTDILAGKDAGLRPFVVPLLMEIQGPDAAKSIAAVLPKVPPAAQAPLLDVLASRADSATRPAILEAMKSTDEPVRIAATRALGAVGTAEDVPALLQSATSSDAALQAAARASLDRLPASVNPALVAALDKADAKSRPELIRTLAARRVAAAMPAITKATADADPATRLASLKAIELLGDEKCISLLIGVIGKPAADEDRVAAEKALGAICGRTESKDTVAESLIASMAGAGAPAKQAILAAQARTGSPKGLAAVRAAMKDADTRDAATRAMTDWPDPAAAPDLLAIAQNDAQQANQVLAIRGLVRLSSLESVAAADKAAMLGKTLAAAKRPEDKRLVLGPLGNLNSMEALRLTAPLLANEALKEEAAAAAVKIAKNLPGQPTAEVKPIMEKALAASTNQATRRGAQEVLNKLPK